MTLSFLHPKCYYGPLGVCNAQLGKSICASHNKLPLGFPSLSLLMLYGPSILLRTALLLLIAIVSSQTHTLRNYSYNFVGPLYLVSAC